MIFVDTVSWLYIFDKRQNSPDALKAREIIKGLKEPLCTSDLIISETHKWLVHHGRPVTSHIKILEKLVNEELATILSIIHPEDRKESLKIVEKYSDQRVSYTDAMTIALMRRHNVKKLFSFDNDFLIFPDIERIPK